MNTTMIPPEIEHNYTMLYVLLWILGCPLVCFGMTICYYKGFCSFKRRITLPHPIECEFRDDSGEYYYTGV